MNNTSPQPNTPQWRRYQELRPSELEACLAAAPVAFWPLGMLEHHGWHLPIGFDGLKVEALCTRVAQETGGVILPTMWWAAEGGHGDFPWTHYQEPQAVADILVTTTRQLVANGFKIVVLLAGHYPWQQLLDEHLPAIAADHLDVLFLWGSEATIGAPQVVMQGDHAAYEESSSGLHLFPDLVDMAALTVNHERRTRWPGERGPSPDERHPDVCYDVADPRFAQAGIDARQASAEHGKDNLEPLIGHLVQVISRQLETARNNIAKQNGHHLTAVNDAHLLLGSLSENEPQN